MIDDTAPWVVCLYVDDLGAGWKKNRESFVRREFHFLFIDITSQDVIYLKKKQQLAASTK